MRPGSAAGRARASEPRIDLHAHSTVSDGTLPPADVVHAAVRAGVDVLALTDHDTAAGWDAAGRAAEEAGLRLVRGMEISTQLRGSGVHLLAYLPDPGHPGLAAELARGLAGRQSRVPAIVERLRAVGVDLAVADVEAAAAGAAATGRPHVADALVARGYVADRREAFDRLLGPGGPAYVVRYAADLEDAIALVRASGGVPVLAHPWARPRARALLDADTLAGLVDVGLAGLEVDHHDHPPEDRRRLRSLAAALELVVTGGSDFHGAGKVDHDLGSQPTDPEVLDRIVQQATSAVPRP